MLEKARSVGNFAAILATIVVIVIWAVVVILEISRAAAVIAADPGAGSIARDVAAFWSAARLALEGRALAAFDFDALAAVQANTDIGRGWALDWLYPPGLMLVLMPLGVLDFIGAWVALVIASGLALTIALRRLVPDWPLVTLLVVFSPATLSCALRGQVLMLFLSAALLGLDALMRGREGRAAG